MIYKIKGKLAKKEESKVIVDVGGLFYEINVSKTVVRSLASSDQNVIELITYHYLNIDKNKAVPVLVGFIDELEKDFFEQFISVSGVGPKAALRAFDKPVSAIARAIEEGDLDFLISLAGIGKQRARQIIAHLQGKVGRFVLIKADEGQQAPLKKEVVEEARKILKRLQYNAKEIDLMIKKALKGKISIDNVEELLNEIYRQGR